MEKNNKEFLKKIAEAGKDIEDILEEKGLSVVFDDRTVFIEERKGKEIFSVPVRFLFSKK